MVLTKGTVTCRAVATGGVYDGSRNFKFTVGNGEVCSMHRPSCIRPTCVHYLILEHGIPCQACTCASRRKSFSCWHNSCVNTCGIQGLLFVLCCTQMNLYCLQWPTLQSLCTF
jgi:hypothetical protein